MGGKQTTKRRPLLGSRFLISKNIKPMLGNGSVNTFPLQRIREWTVLSARAVPRSYKEDSWGNQVRSVREYSSVGRELPFRKDLSTEAEESPLLEAFTRERLVKTQQTVKDLAGGVMICKVWRLAEDAVIKCSP
jgi:hypothetical protein